MPVMNGVVRKLREMPRFRDTPIISISASIYPSDRQSCLAAGANAFVPKPVRLAELIRAIGELMRLTWRYA